MTKLEELPENDLIKMAQEKDRHAIDILMQRYKSIVRKKARPLFIMGGDQDDLIQEGMIGLFKAIQCFDDTKETVFSTFAELCISRQLYDVIRSSNRQKNIPLNTYVSIYSPTYTQEYAKQGSRPMVDQSLEAIEMSPEEILIDRENVKHLMSEIYKRLSKMECQIFELYMNGMTYQEISKHMDKEPKSIDNALQRIKRKVSESLHQE